MAYVACFLAGLAALVAGIYGLAGLWWALLSSGAILTAVGVLGRAAPLGTDGGAP